MKRRIVFYGFDRILTENEVIDKIDSRISELYSQGFNNFQILKIVFDCNEFKENFIDSEVYEKIVNKYKLALTAGQK